MPDLELLRRCVHIGVVGLGVELITDLAVILRGQNQMHQRTGDAVDKIILRGFALLNDRLELFLHLVVAAQVEGDRAGVGGGEELGVQICDHAQRVVLATALHEAVDAVEGSVLLLHLLDELLVIVDGNGHGLGLDLVASASSAGGAVGLRLRIGETLGLHGTRGGIAGEVAVLHVGGNRALLDVLDHLAILFLEEVVGLGIGASGQDCQRCYSCHNQIILS